MNYPSIYEYQGAREFLKDSISARKKAEEGFTIRKFCKSSDFGSHALLVMVLNGRRRVTLKQVPALTRGLGLSHEEKNYLQTLIQIDNSTSAEEKALCKQWLSELKPKRGYRILEVEQYHLIADWIHMAILSLAKIDGVVISPETIYPLVGKKISESKIGEAISRLTHLGLLRPDEKGDLRPSAPSVKTRDDVASRGAREYHRQVSTLAAQAVEEQAVNEREFQSFSVTVPKGSVDLAKTMIRNFRHQLVQVLEAAPGSDVYQCNLHFFRLAKGVSEAGSHSVQEGVLK